jgi:hypothetical protein
MKNLIYIIIIIISCVRLNPAQENKFLNKLNKSSQAPPVQTVFQELEEAISKANVTSISRYFSTQTYFSLRNGSSGYYSSNQAFYILENFFNVYQVKSFRFNNIQSGNGNPYGTGLYIFDLKGKRDNAQVYVSLKLTGTNWKITQITIN